MPTVLDWNATVDPSEVVGIIREAVAAGSSVVLPGDCGYSALVNPAGPDAVTRLNALADASGAPPAVLAWGPDDPAGLGLAVSLPARRLMLRAWPAPLVLAVPGIPDWPKNWSQGVRELLTKYDGCVRFRCPDHALSAAVVPALELPVLVADTFLPTAEEALDVLNDPAAVAVSVGGRAVEGRPTVVRVSGAGLEIEEEGLFPTNEIEKLAARIVLFICTGNTCRSALAEGLAKKLLADRLGCDFDELPRRGMWVLSAGVSAFGGCPAAAESVAVAAEFGADLSEHQSRPVNPQLLAAADVVIAMTAGHIRALVNNFPGIGPEPRLLGGDDLDDPIGAGLNVYRECARTIIAHLERYLSEWIGK